MKPISQEKEQNIVVLIEKGRSSRDCKEYGFGTIHN